MQRVDAEWWPIAMELDRAHGTARVRPSGTRASLERAVMERDGHRHPAAALDLVGVIPLVG